MFKILYFTIILQLVQTLIAVCVIHTNLKYFLQYKKYCSQGIFSKVQECLTNL